jgi:hypothetical protein
MVRLIVSGAAAVLGIALSACSGGPSPEVFDGVSDADLASQDIAIVKYQPTQTPRFSDAAIRDTLLQSPGVTIDSSQLVLVGSKSPSDRAQPHLAWAIRVNTSHVPDWVAGCAGPACQFGPGPLFHIMFYDAESGRPLGSFTRFPPNTPIYSFTQPPTP